MGLNYFQFINNTRVFQDKIMTPAKEERGRVILPNNEVYIALADKSPETAYILEVYDFSSYRRKQRAELSIPQVEAEIDRLIFNMK